ncbi:hypothetical protein CsSME_00008635 [Camellia sinensis var. sinensis]
MSIFPFHTGLWVYPHEGVVHGARRRCSTYSGRGRVWSILCRIVTSSSE